jgi:Zn-dependent peptidase ImmA (M78 family)
MPRDQRYEFSRELLYWMRVMDGRQEWLAERWVSEAREPIPYIGKTNLDEDIVTVGRRLRDILDVSLEAQKAARDKAAAFRLWRLHCEQAGVCVFLARKVDVKEMRGFALSHPSAPIVVVNGKDADAGKTFTLMHEMVHILLNVSGVSDRNIGRRAHTFEQRVEAFCNAAAAEALVPRDDFRRSIEGHEDDYEAAIPLIAESCRVSDDVIARRLFDESLITRTHYEKLLAQFHDRRSLQRKKKQKTGPPPARMVLSNVGRTFGREVVDAFHADEITGSDLSDLLGMKTQYLPKFEKELFGGM